MTGGCCVFQILSVDGKHLTLFQSEAGPWVSRDKIGPKYELNHFKILRAASSFHKIKRLKAHSSNLQKDTLVGF